MISHKYSVIFIHVNKTGGTSVEDAFREPNWDHQTPDEYIEMYGKDVWDSYFKFATVRNPWDRMVSLYHFNTKAHGENRKFPEWLEDAVYNPNKFKGPQLDWITLDGKICVDFICRFETLNLDFQKVCKHLDVNLTLPHSNKSNHDHYSRYYDTRLKNILEEAHQKDVEAFNYVFDIPML